MRQKPRISPKLTYFLAGPITALVLATVGLAVWLGAYDMRHEGQIYTGVSVWDVDLSQMSQAEAEASLADAFSYWQEQTISFTDSETGQSWTKSPAELGVYVDVSATAQAAYAVGRQGGPWQRVQDLFTTWYYGRSLPPTLVIDESQIDQSLDEIAAAIDQPVINATIDTSDNRFDYVPSQFGRQLDRADVRQRLLQPVSDQSGSSLPLMRSAQVELLVHDLPPVITDSGDRSYQIQQALSGPMLFYIKEPLDNDDLLRVSLPAEELARWLRVDVITGDDGSYTHDLYIDENAARHWLNQFTRQLYRDPVNARFYFDDFTEELILVAPHVNGRELDLEATIERLRQQILTGNRSVPFIFRENVPTAHAGATAAELGITELVSERTTWFFGSSDNRKHNIARSAANFYGIVVAPGEEFSFNRYLGTISEADGYEVGLIIFGGRTIEGVGGGICQVSTTMFQTAFYAGFPVTERWEHGYMVGYYEDGEGQGMDATVFSPIVDLKFINNTPYHLLIENYYNEEFESLTFKFYSTSLGRTVEKVGPFFENEQPAPGRERDIWEFSEDLEPGTVEQFDWATIGARVTVERIVRNADGEVIAGTQTFVSNYIPWPNGYRYGPDVEPFDYSRVPPDPFANR
jgi:vancomycin resistance protein YoaR